jgi:SNF2 family DNA or RNA helicase
MSSEIINKTSTNVPSKFDIFIASRMKRFEFLLDNAKFTFKQYQYDGVQWCISNELRRNPPGKVRGGIIADEMGLGKTIMMIGTMFTNFLPRTLIIVPPVLIKQWFNELYKVSGHQALLYYGVSKKLITQTDINRSIIVITTYNAILPDECPLKNIVWDRVIFDEAHHLRNSKTRRYLSCKEIKSNIRWIVTGTPIQNKKQDFYTLCSACGMNKSFYTLPTNLNIIYRYFILRRTKTQVGINLPPVNQNNEIVEWKNRNEMLLSEEIHSLLPNQTGVSGAKRQQLANTFGPNSSLVAILRARQSCILPFMMRKELQTFTSMGIINTNYLDALNYSSKIDAVVELILRRKDNSKGKIIFCHYRDEIDVIATRLEKGGMLKVVRYDGRNSGGKNLALLSEPADALVLQIQTGCEGLNLQHNFSEIYFVSPHWNPFVEEQAIARCHRIGQINPVDVFKFEMRGFSKNLSIEKYVNTVQDIKRDISRQLLDSQSQ